MSDFWHRFKKHLLIFLAVAGPGLITAVADNDASGVATYTVAASLYGMSSQYLVVLTTLLLGVTQEIGARMAIVTGKGLGDLIREHYGVRVSVFIFLIYFLANQAVILQDVSGLKSSIQLFNLPWQLMLVVVCTLLILLVVWLDFKRLQRIFLFAILFYATYIFSAVLANPNWGQSLKESLILPQRAFIYNSGYWLALIAVLGTTVTAWGQFFINSFMADKGLRPHELKAARWEVYLGAFLTNFLSWMMAIAVTYTLFKHGIRVTDGYTAALAIKPLAGALSGTLFAVGLLAASFLGLTIIPLATTYVFTELFGYERTLNASFTKGRVFYLFFILQIILGLLISLFPNINLFNITLWANYLNGAILPVIFYFVIKFSEDSAIMGEYISRGFSKWYLRGASALILVATLATLYGNFIH
ncbi:MAG: divalent metal cation transporter [Patescibacteria group bacterium]|nr:divalent metal cation transporter [Patescibacteria group bacterium]